MCFYEGTTETILFDLFECGLFPYTPIKNSLEDVEVSFVFGDRDWVDSLGSEVLITAKRKR